MTHQMLGNVALWVVMGYVVLGTAAQAFVRVEDDDITNDELLSMLVWFVAAVVGAVFMLVLGFEPIAIVISTLIVTVGGGLTYMFVHYRVWGAHLLSIGRPGSALRAIAAWATLGFAVILPISLHILVTPATETVDDRWLVSIAIGLVGAIALSLLVLRARWG